MQMGLTVVLLLYLVLLTGAAAVCSATLGGGTAWYLRSIPHRKGRFIVLAAALPFLCVLFAGIWFIGYFAISDTVFHHDPMIGDSWYTNIGNGYAIDMIDVTDQGIVHPTTGESNGLNNLNGIRGVRRLQISPPFLYIGQDSQGFQHLGSDNANEDTYLAIDMRSQTKQILKSQRDLQDFAAQHGQTLHLEPILMVYQQQRSYGFDLIAAAVLLLVPLAALCLFLRAVHHFQSKATLSPDPVR
jgi:hypothetical protein